MIPLLTLNHLQIERDHARVLDLAQLELQRGEILAVIGPNGAGKSTLMMALSGLIPVKSGQIVFDGKVVTPHSDLAFRRRVAIVMQAPLLMHGTVSDNIASGLKFRQVPSPEIRERVEDWLKRLKIEHLKNRSAHKLSGGEAQRVSLARALVLQPDLLLLDEPFSALDAPTRAQLIGDLKKLLSGTHLTTLMITHDLDEALALADRVAILMNGQLRQVGTPREVFSTPADPEIAHFTGVETIFSGKIVRQQEGLADVECGPFTLQAISDAPLGARVYLCLRPEDITLSTESTPHKTSARNVLRGTIQLLVSQGPLVRAIIAGPVQMVALITRASAQEMNLAIGQEILASFKTTAIHVIQQ
jgi:tungstate transport system ATP-binding protein